MLSSLGNLRIKGHKEMSMSKKAHQTTNTPKSAAGCNYIEMGGVWGRAAHHFVWL
jgi:hypothetical protein